MNRALSVMMLIAVGVTVGANSAAAPSWPSVGGGPTRNAVAHPVPFEIGRWDFDIGGDWGSTSTAPLLVGSTILVGTTRGIVALRADDGELLWRAREDREVLLPLGYEDGTVYALLNRGEVAAIRADDGAVIWSVNAQAGAQGSPIVDEGTVYAAFGGSCRSFRAGAEVWRFQTGASTSSPELSDGTLICPSSDGNLYGINAANGSKEWSLFVADRLGESIVSRDGGVYVAAARDLLSVSGQTGNARWAKKTTESTGLPPSLYERHVLAASVNGLASYDVTDGAQEWWADAGLATVAPVVAADLVYVGNVIGEIKVYNASTGQFAGSVIVGVIVKGGPVVAMGGLFAVVAGYNGTSRTNLLVARPLSELSNSSVPGIGLAGVVGAAVLLASAVRRPAVREK